MFGLALVRCRFAEGIAALAQWLGEQNVSVAVCEPTGGYERLLISQLEEAGFRIHLAHPNKVRSFARACGHEAKNGLDAQVLSRFGQVFALADAPQSKPDPERAELQDLLRRRRQLVDQRVAELRLDKGIAQGARTSTQRHSLADEIARLDEEYQATLQSSQEAAGCHVMRGVGPLRPPWRRTCRNWQGDGRRLVSLVGLAPWSRDSGRLPSVVALYLAALSVIRSKDSALRAFTSINGASLAK